MFLNQYFKFLVLLFIITTSMFAKEGKLCVYVNSYHEGYFWSDRIAETIKNTLEDSCEIIRFDMDSKRNKNVEFIKKKALEAKELIERVKPDIVITSDDNAAKYLIKPYFKNSEIPFVFCGVNWSSKEYGLESYKNVTGIIEISPIKPVFELATSLSKGKKGLFLGENSVTDIKKLKYLQRYVKKNNIILDKSFPLSIEEWKKIYIDAQSKYDFIIMGGYVTIKNWDIEDIKSFVFNNSKILTLCREENVINYSMIGLVVDPREQGLWAANAVKAILRGFPVEHISITTNKTWNNILNMKLIKKAGIKISRNLLIKSKQL